jgi:hypothetical protein
MMDEVENKPMQAPAVKKKKKNFVDNKLFFQSMSDYRKLCDEAKENSQPKPRISNYIGKTFLDIAEHLSMRPNFSNYIFRQDMVMDAVENMIVYAGNFDPERSSNPFSYFTQVAWYAFIRRIAKEKKQIEICDKIIDDAGFECFFEGSSDGKASDYNSIVDSVTFKTRTTRRSDS